MRTRRQVTEPEKKKMRKLRASGLPVQEIAKKLKRDRTVVTMFTRDMSTRKKKEVVETGLFDVVRHAKEMLIYDHP